MTFIFRFFDYFLPASLRNNPADLLRGYIIVGMIATNIIVCLCMLVLLRYFLALEQNTIIAISLDLACLLAYLAALLLLRSTQNLVLCANFLLTMWSPQCCASPPTSVRCLTSVMCSCCRARS